jgi:hypothetical protein
MAQMTSAKQCMQVAAVHLPLTLRILLRGIVYLTSDKYLDQSRLRI